ncbi:hypothetical protein ACFL34_04125 [Candidatus Sumerlaeota bacterium]
MIDIASYSLKGDKVFVKLKCECGNRRMVRSGDGDEMKLRCPECNANTTLGELRNAATLYWQSRPWEVDAVAERRSAPRHDVEIPVTLKFRASRESPVYCTLNGCCVVLSEHGVLCLVDNFEEELFPSLTTQQRFVVVCATNPPAMFPSEVYTRLVGIKYKKEQLPLCQVTLSLRESLPAMQEQVKEYIQFLTEQDEKKQNGGQSDDTGG